MPFGRHSICRRLVISRVSRGIQNVCAEVPLRESTDEKSGLPA